MDECEYSLLVSNLGEGQTGKNSVCLRPSLSTSHVIAQKIRINWNNPSFICLYYRRTLRSCNTAGHSQSPTMQEASTWERLFDRKHKSQWKHSSWNWLLNWKTSYQHASSPKCVARKESVSFTLRWLYSGKVQLIWGYWFYRRVGRGAPHHEKLPCSKKCQLSLNELCFSVQVALLGPSFGTAGNWIPYKSNVVSLSAALDICCMTSPYSYLLFAVKSSGGAIKII